MNARERMSAVFNHQKPDRIPTDIWAVPEVWAKLKKHFGENVDLYEALHIDSMAGTGPKYIGPPLPEVGPDERIDFWGIRSKKQLYAGGEYYEMSASPLSGAQTIDDLERYNWPTADWFDYSGMKAQAQLNHDKKLIGCGYMAPFTYHLYLRGLENALTDPLLEPEFTRHLLDRLCGYFYEHHKRMFEAAEGLIDHTQVTDDLGTQNGPMMSLPTWRAFYKPWLKKFIDLAHSYNAKVFHHDDGAIREFLPELVEMGIDVLNPIQWRCPGMDRRELKREFGQKICFHGAMDNQHTMPFGSQADVRREVRENIDILASDGTGYCLAPCHNLQAITPVENIIAMYDEAQKYGKL